jgi:uncharacterized membrane protein
MNKIFLFRWVTLLGYFGLIALIFIWNLWVEPRPAEQLSLTFLMQMGPLMFALRGLLHGKVYTHAWSMYLALMYFVIGIWFAGDESTRVYGVLFSILSLHFFIGTVFYTRFQGKAENLEREQNDS